MGLKCGHRISAHLACLDQLVLHLVQLQGPEALTGVFMFLDEAMLFLAVHVTISMARADSHK
jgi:hypothetical protein